MDKKLSELSIQRTDFSEDFLWGASIAAYQVEGNAANQWSRWEQDNAARLAANAEQDLHWSPVRNDVSPEATTRENYICADGIRHYEKYEEDFSIAKKIGLNSVRVGLEWSRIMPEPGKVDPAEIEHYRLYLSSLVKRGLKPVVTLQHWTEPQWFTDMGGFTKRGNLLYWQHYVYAVLESLDWRQIEYVISINEANTFMIMGYIVGQHAPGHKNPIKAWMAYRNLARAHQTVYDSFHAKFPHIKVGFAHQYNKIIATRRWGRVQAAFQKWWWNTSWISWAGRFDFIGVNYYFSNYWSGRELGFDINREPPVNDLGWNMEPGGIEWVLKDIAQRWPGVPVLITENGVADMHDAYREWWIAETIEAMARARAAGVNLIGYLHWSLIDNFEWQFGWWPKFGLIAVDMKTMKRTVRESSFAWSAWLNGQK